MLIYLLNINSIPNTFMVFLCFMSFSCSYSYTAFGNLYQRNCTDSTLATYIIDPFGYFGDDIVAEVSMTCTVHLHTYITEYIKKKVNLQRYILNFNHTRQHLIKQLYT